MENNGFICKKTELNQIKIIASSISNLTDARYFAAWAVEALSFDLNKVDRDEYFAIKDWVEGVKILLETTEEFSDLEIHEADGIIYMIDNDVKDHDVLSSQTKVSASLSIIEKLSFAEGQILRAGNEWHQLNKEEQINWIKFAKDNRCFLDLPLSIADLETYAESDLIYGLVLRGGDEEKVGFKSYDELDQIFDIVI